MGKENGQSLGGEDDRNDFVVIELTPYYDKLDHFLRSVANQPNHIKARNKIVGPLTIGGDQVLGVTIGTYRENKRRMKKF